MCTQSKVNQILQFLEDVTHWGETPYTEKEEEETRLGFILLLKFWLFICSHRTTFRPAAVGWLLLTARTSGIGAAGMEPAILGVLVIPFRIGGYTKMQSVLVKRNNQKLSTNFLAITEPSLKTNAPIYLQLGANCLR